MSTVKELRATAKELGITGVWDMNKSQLEAAIKTLQLKPKLNPAGNVPWAKKFYFIQPDAVNEDDLAKAPRQVRQIVRTMLAENITDESTAMQGGPIVDKAREHGLESNIRSAALFAYYVKNQKKGRVNLEQYGVVAA